VNRTSLFFVAVSQSLYVVACGSGNGGGPANSNDGGVLDGSSGGDTGSSSGACEGTAPSCFGDDLQSCCGQDPSGPAVCKETQWMCGPAGAPGCNGSSCIQPADGGSGQCIGAAPDCFGDDLQECCGQDPSGVATCIGAQWMCGSVGAPGCDGTSCLQPIDASADACPSNPVDDSPCTDNGLSCPFPVRGGCTCEEGDAGLAWSCFYPP
jgi:hypothetical protein